MSISGSKKSLEIVTSASLKVSLKVSLNDEFIFIIRSYKHEIYSEEVNKVALSGDDDKRIVMSDRIRTLVYGHYRAETI